MCNLINTHTHFPPWADQCEWDKMTIINMCNLINTIASSSFILFFTCIGIPIYVVYFVCDSASEFGAMGSTSFFGVSLPCYF